MAKATLWERIKNKVKEWVGGGSSKSSTSKAKSTTSSSSRSQASRTLYYGGGARASVEKEKAEARRKEERAAAFKAVKREYKDIGESVKKKQAPPDPKVEAAKASRERLDKKLEEKKQERKEWHEASGHRFDVGEKGISKEEKARRRQNVKMQTYDPKTAVKEAEHQMKWHGKEESFTRGALSGVTFGASDLAVKKLAKGEAKKAEEVYQKNKNKGYEIAGEVAGSLASFGGTAGLTEKAGAKIGTKLAPKLEGKLVQNAAKRSVNKAVKKGLVSEASEELIKQVGKEKAVKIANAVGNDIVQNATVGLLYDFNKASTEHEIGSPEWWREMGTSAAFNAAITGAVAGGSMATGGKRMVKDAASRLRARNQIFDSANQASERLAKTGIPETENVRIADLARRSDATTPPRAKEAPDNAQINLEDAVRSADGAEVKPNVEPLKTEPPKTKEAKRAAEEAAEESFAPKMRDRYKHLNEDLKKSTDNKVGVRKGIIIAEERASDEERKRIIKESGAEFGRKIKEAFDNAIHGGDFTYKILTQGQRDDMFFDSYKKVKNAESVSQIVEELEEKMDRILRDSAWDTNEQITLKDLSDMLAVEQLYKDSGKPLPPEYEKILTRMTTLQGTQYGQGMKGRHLLLMERSPRYRQAMMEKDIAKYIDNVFGSDKLGDISRSLDANHGEKDWLQNELKRISDYENTFKDLPIDERLAAAKEAYKELEKEILRNTKMTVWDVLNLIRHTGMLSAIATGGRNLLGNTSQFLMRELSDKMTYFAERGLAKASGMSDEFRPTTVLTYKGKDSKSLANHITNGAVGKLTKTDDAYFEKFSDPEYARKITDVINEAVGDMMNIEKYETHAQKGADYVAVKTGEKVIKGLAWLPRKTTKAVNFMLNEPDSWFVEGRFRKSLMRYLEANGITDSASLAGKDSILKDAIDHAKNHALEDTYKKANRVTTVLENVRKAGLKHDDNMWRNLAKKGAMITLDAELPYLKVPVNVGINTVKYSPINVMKSLVDVRTAIKRGDVEALTKTAEELSKGFTGTGLAVLGFLMTCDEQEDENSNGFIAKADDWLKEYGIKDYSLKVGDKVYDISNIGQGATQILMGTRAGEIVNENGGAPKGFLDKLDLVAQCFGASVDSISEMGILDNALGVVDAFSNEGDYEKGLSERFGDAATNIGWDYVGQYVPQPLRGVARGMTSADLDTGVKKGDTTATQRRLEYNKNKLISALPVVNERNLPHKVDTHGNLVNERATNADKLKAIANNLANPVKVTKVHIPEADKIEMSVKDENGKPFKPTGFDSKREYKAKVGVGKGRVEIDLTGKEREQVARAAKYSGYDGATNVIKKGMFGDRLGERAQYILNNIPDDEEKAREFIFSTPEWKNADNSQKETWLKAWYGEGQPNKGVNRTRNAEAFIEIAGNSEGDFRWQNDLSASYQTKYNEAGLADMGIAKGTWVDILEACQDSNHKWNEETLKNQDTINSAKKTKLGILSVEGLTAEQRVAAYQVIRGKRTGFGWNDWDGVSSGGGYYRGYGRRGWRSYGSSGSGSKARALKQSSFKATKRTYKDTAATLKTSSSRSKGLSTTSTVKVEPPKVKFKKYEV